MYTKRHFNQFFGFLLIAFVVLLLGSRSVHAVEIKIERPGDREFVRDMAGMLDSESKTQIVDLCTKLLKAKATPIIVVTIESMAKHGGEGMRIETFAMLLFNQWEIGHAKLGEHDWNTGILLLVSKGDRKARIELGKGWGREKDVLCGQIMNEQIITRFKEGKFSEGIVAGVDALDKMARELELPSAPPPPPRPWWHYALVVGFVCMMIFTIISLIRRGSSGWAWLLWAALFGIAGYMLYQMLTSSSRGGGGGGFGGGSFGGGFSGGGGATGSW